MEDERAPEGGKRFLSLESRSRQAHGSASSCPANSVCFANYQLIFPQSLHALPIVEKLPVGVCLADRNSTAGNWLRIQFI
jgi:hypothetical protein